MHEEQLRYFLSAARCGSFSAAARACYVAQPTVSRQVAALEQEIGTPLFVRTGRSLTLTPIGSYMMEMAQNYLDQCARLRSSCRQFGPVQEDLLTVRFSPWESYLLAEPLARFSEGGKRRYLSVSNSYTHLVPWLRWNQPFLAFCPEQCAAQAGIPLTVTPVYRKPWRVATSITSPLWQLPAEKRAMLEDQTVILSNPQVDQIAAVTPGAASFELDLFPPELRPQKVIHGGILFTQLAMARAGYGVLIVPPWLPEYLLEGLRTEDCLAVPYAPTIVMVENPNLRHPQLPALKQLCLDHFQALGTLE